MSLDIYPPPTEDNTRVTKCTINDFACSTSPSNLKLWSLPSTTWKQVFIFILFLFKVFSDRISAKDCESCVEGEEDVISPEKKELSGVEKV